jgi:N-acetyl-1-D-myo-inositol-2-amino-2-deoxy-alpha-D-glucopyranoside deacetylase
LRRSVERAAASRAGFGLVEDVSTLPFGNAETDVSTAIDAGSRHGAKLAALAAHATQIRVADGCYALADGVGFQVQSVEYFRLVRGVPAGPFDRDGRETDLFAGVA